MDMSDHYCLRGEQSRNSVLRCYTNNKMRHTDQHQSLAKAGMFMSFTI